MRFCTASLMVLMLVVFLCGCGGKAAAPVREPVEIELLFSADKEMNPSLKGRPSPLAVRVFELKATGAFEESDYFSLQTDAKAVLGEDMLPGGSSFVIKPGARREIRKTASQGITALGFIAGYRDIAGATWQAVYPVPLPPEEGMFSSPVKIRLDIRFLESDMQISPQR